MRDIKFRLYNEEDNRMEQVTSITSFTPEGLICDSEFEGEESEWVVTQPIMQFTGLTDCNGVDIYESDIVKWDDCSKGRYWRVATVSYGKGNNLEFRCFDCPLIENSSAHGHIFKFGSFIYTDTENHLEVIGNIYQNPELLENNQ